MYNRLLNTRITYLYCTTLSVLLVCAGSWWYFFYRPSLAATTLMQQNIAQMYAQIDELRKLEKSLAGISQSIDALKQNVQKHSAAKTRNYAVQQNLSLIADLATGSGLSVGSCRSCGCKNESDCIIHAISGDFKGSFDQIISFFDVLKNSKHSVAINTYELAKIDTALFSLHATFSMYI